MHTRHKRQIISFISSSNYARHAHSSPLLIGRDGLSDFPVMAIWICNATNPPPVLLRDYESVVARLNEVLASKGETAVKQS